MQETRPSVESTPLLSRSLRETSSPAAGTASMRASASSFLLCAGLVLASLLLLPNAASAVLLLGTGDPAANTSAPADELADSGWQHEGLWGNFTGTAIASQFFLTARHVGGEIGQVFKYQGVDYLTTAFYDDPKSDLRIWRIASAFPSYAPLHDGADEIGKRFVVIGRGTQRGDEIWSDPSPPKVVRALSRPSRSITPAGAVVLCGKDRDGLPPRKRPGNSTSPVTTPPTPPPGSSLKGWENGPADGVQRWGENQFSGVLKFGSSLGEILTATFDADGGPNEATLSVGDSGGGVFVNTDGGWKLAGINYGVSGPYKRNGTSPAIYGAIFNECGLYKGARLITDRPQPSPGTMYITRISARIDWIHDIIDPR